jgi:Esterase FrsA-like
MTLSSDGTFNFNLLRWLGLAPYHGSDVAEVLDVAGRITPGDFESWHREFMALARQVEHEGWERHRSSPVTLRGRAFRAAAYYRAADFFLHGNPHDPRIMSTWAAATEQFNRAIAQLTPPGERVTIQADGFAVPAILYRAGPEASPRPTVLMFNGFDGSQEEMLHVCGFAALERGFHVLTFEGPGQPSVVRGQGLGFRHDWEQVVTPVVDYCESVPQIDASRLGLIGLSFGGYLAPRAAAFIPRIRAVAAIDGLFDGYEAVTNILDAGLRALLNEQRVDAFNEATTAPWSATVGCTGTSSKACGRFACVRRTSFSIAPARTRWQAWSTALCVRCWCARLTTSTSTRGRPNSWPQRWATARRCVASQRRNPRALIPISGPRC